MESLPRGHRPRQRLPGRRREPQRPPGSYPARFAARSSDGPFGERRTRPHIVFDLQQRFAQPPDTGPRRRVLHGCKCLIARCLAGPEGDRDEGPVLVAGQARTMTAQLAGAQRGLPPVLAESGLVLCLHTPAVERDKALGGWRGPVHRTGLWADGARKVHTFRRPGPAHPSRSFSPVGRNAACLRAVQLALNEETPLAASVSQVPAQDGPPASLGDILPVLLTQLHDHDLFVVARDEPAAAALALALAGGAPEATIALCPGSDAMPGDSAPPSPSNVG